MKTEIEKKKNSVKLGFFGLELGKNILFGIGNGAEFLPQNRVIKSPGELNDFFYILHID